MKQGAENKLWKIISESCPKNSSSYDNDIIGFLPICYSCKSQENCREARYKSSTDKTINDVY